MKLDTSSYYPKSPLDDDDDYIRDDNRRFQPGYEEEKQTVVPDEAPASLSIDASQSPSSNSEAANEPDEDDVPDDIGMKPVPEEPNTFITGLSHLLSWVFVPLMMPVYGVLLAFNLSILDFVPTYQKTVFTLIVAAINIAIPAFCILMLKRMGVVKDVGLNYRKERTIPYIITILCMGGTALFMQQKGAPMWLVMFFAGGGLAGIIELLVNFRWKISAHAAGIAGLVAMLLRILRDGIPQPACIVWFLIAVAAAGMLGSARIWLGRHTIWQVLAGYAVGFCSVYFLSMIM